MTIGEAVEAGYESALDAVAGAPIEPLRVVSPPVIELVPEFVEPVDSGGAPLAHDVSASTALAPPTAVRMTAFERAVKRAVDVVVSSALLLISLPLFAVIAIAVRCTSRGPIIFRHTRVGRGGASIRVSKFRTMVPDALTILESDPELKQRYVDGGFKLQQHEDPRLTRMGRVLRRLSLDELPQLWDVFVGRMSLVGPRPVVAEELPSYGDKLGGYLAVKPGLTGLWQVGGRSDVAFPERSAIDMYYATRWNLWLDVKVLVRTVPAVVRRRGAY